MPASSSETRGRWRKRKREPPSGRKSRLRETENDDTFEENEDDDDPDLDPPQNHVETDDGPDVGNHILQEKESELLADGGVRLCEFPTAVKRAVIRPHSSVFGIVEAERLAQDGDNTDQNQAVVPLLENISYGQLQALSSIARDSSSLSGVPIEETSSGSGSYVIKPPRITPGCGVIKRLGSAARVHVVPAHSDWFSLNTVHRLERQVVPHFFCGKSAEYTPEKYMECRNFIVAKYMENPEIHLTVSECQGLVSGIEIDDLNRIVRFLDHWGIINYCATPLTREAQNDETYLFEDSSGELHVPSAALKSIDSLIKFNKPKCRLKAIDVYPEIANQRDEDSDYDSTIRERLSENQCHHCGRCLTTVYYQSNKEVDVLLCLECFHEGRFVTGHSSLDFVKVNSMKDYGDVDGDSWSDQETLLLLEGVQLYNENWNKIADHVGTKSKPQCILHFVRLPLDGAPLENIDMPSTSGSSNTCHHDEQEKTDPHSNGFSLQESGSESDFPFKNHENPVMSLVSFVASVFGPRVAAACAHASLASLCKNGDKDVNPHEDAATAQAHTEEGKPTPLSAEKVMAAAKDGLAAAAVKAKLFADHEEREIQRSSANIVNHQMKRLELKLKQIAEIETLLMRECEQMERARQRFTSERTLLASSQQYGSPRPMMNLQSTTNAIATNNRPQISGLQQPLVTSSYGNNQPVRPHMSLMHQPGMYGLNPRLRLSTMQQPSSSSFNPQSNTQSALAHQMLRHVSGTKSSLG